jgi:autotransporter-associated beta strand protein
MNTKTLLAGVAATLAVVGLTFSAHAQTNTFIGAANGAYNAATSWSLGVRPTTNDVVIINNGVNARLAANQNGVAGTLTIGGASGTSSLEVRPNTVGSTASLTVAGNLTLAPGAGGGTLNIQFPGAAVTLNGGNGSIVRGAGAGVADLVVANWSGSLGLATATVDNLNLAQTGATTFDITNNQTYNVSDLVRVNNNGNGVDSVLNINGGMLNLGNSTTGPNERGQLSFNSGTSAGNNTTVNLNNGGTLIAKDILRQNTGSAVLNFNDGKIATRSDGNLNIRSTSSAGPMEIALAETGTHTFEAAEGRSIIVQSTALLKDKAGEAGTLTKTGTGTLLIDSASTYTGATTINAGSLILGETGSIGSSSVLSVASGATLNVSAVTGGFVVGGSQALRGSGTVVGNTTVNGALQPGNSAGLLNFSNNLTLGSTATTTMEINGSGDRGTAFDAIDVGGLLTYGGALTLSFGATFVVEGSYSFDLFNSFSTSATNSFDSVDLGGLYSGSLINNGSGVWGLTSGVDTWTFTESSGLLALEVVPEPSTYALLVLAAAGLGAHVVRRRRSSNR